MWVPKSRLSFETRKLAVDDDTRDNKAWTREDPNGTAVRVAVAADRRALEQRFIDTLVGEPTRLGYLDASAEEVDYLTALAGIEEAAARQFNVVFGQAEIDVEQRDGPRADETFFLAVVAEALADVFSGPWSERLDGLASIDVPKSLTEAHDEYVAALQAFSTAESGLRVTRESNNGDGFSNSSHRLQKHVRLCSWKRRRDWGTSTSAATEGARRIAGSLACRYGSAPWMDRTRRRHPR